MAFIYAFFLFDDWKKRINCGLKKICVSVLFTGAIIFFAPLPSFASPPVKILFISSYHPGHPVFFSQVDGIRSVLNRNKYLLDIEYMDAKRFNAPERINTFRSTLAYKVENGLSYDMIMTGDDDALRFSLDNHASLFQQKPIAFFGVHDDRLAFHQNTNPRVTGLAESVSMAETVALIIRLHPRIKRIIALTDGTAAGKANLDSFYRIAEGRSENIVFSDISLKKNTFDEFADQLSGVDSKSAVLLLSAHQDRHQAFLPFYESLNLIKQHLKAPLYHLWQYGIGDGIIGGKVNSQYTMARTAAQIVEEIVNGRAVHSIPVVRENLTRYVFDYIEMKKQGISVSQLPEGAEVINQPMSFLKEYSRIIWGAAIFTVLQAVILFLLAVNILNRRRSEQALAESEDNYRLIIKHQNDLVVKMDPEKRMLFASPSYCRTFGRTEAEIVGKRFFPQIHKDDHARVHESLISLKTPPHITYHEERAMTPGGWRWFGWSARAALKEDGSIAYIVSVGRDISLQKDTEEALRENEERLRTLINSMPDIVCFKDGEGRWLEVNNFYLRLIDIAQLDYRGKTNSELAESAPFFADFLRRCGKTDQAAWDLETPRRGDEEIFFPDGSSLIFDIIKVPAFHMDGRRKGLIVVGRDVTKRKQIEREHARLAAAIEQADEAIVITDSDGNIHYANPAFENTTGYTQSEVSGKNPRVLKSGEHDDRFYRHLWSTISKGQVWKGRFINRHKDGHLFYEEATISPIRDSEGGIHSFVAVKRNITREIELEKQLRQTQKMEAMGTLAGGIAHDFNNILFPVIGFTEMALEDAPQESQQADYLKRVLQGAGRAQELVKQILTFSRQAAQEIKPLKIQIILKETLKLVRSSLPSTIDIKVKIEESCGMVLADPTQVHQVIMNLITNAYHAMEAGGGSLEVELLPVRLEKEDLNDPDVQPGEFTCIRIKDTGMGMEPGVASKIFDPYFTTKEEGKGTGLGLSVVHGIVRACGGEIQVDSLLGKGTEFRVYLPAAETSEEAESGDDALPLQPGDERILLVDDEKIIVNMVSQMLVRQGYKVTKHTSSEAALQSFRMTPDAFDLVITDMTMPRMTGAVLAKHLMEIRPDLPIIICTGFSDQINEETAKKMGIRGFILKPVLKNEMVRTIRDVLER